MCAKISMNGRIYRFSTLAEVTNRSWPLFMSAQNMIWSKCERLQAISFFCFRLSGHLELPIPGINEIFDIDGSLLHKGDGEDILNAAIEFPLTLSDPHERAPYTLKYAFWAPDRHMQYGHVLPNINPYLIGKDTIMQRLRQNRLNPTMVG